MLNGRRKTEREREKEREGEYTLIKDDMSVAS